MLPQKIEALLKKVVVTHVRQFFQSNFFKVHCCWHMLRDIGARNPFNATFNEFLGTAALRHQK